MPRSASLADDMAGSTAVVPHEHPGDAMSRPHAVAETPSDSPSFQQAFAAAKEEHSAKAEQVPAAEASTDDDEDADVPPTQTAVAPAASVESAKSETPDLISDTEYTALTAKYANDPVKLVKALNRAYTQKSQARAADLRTYERVKPYVELIDAYDEDPDAVLAALAEERGFHLAPRGQSPTSEAATAAAESAQPAVDQLVDRFRQKLGPELEYLAEGLTPAIRDLVETLTQSTVDKTTAPLKAQQDALVARVADEQTTVVMKTFGDRHPDWQEHEPAMLKIAEGLAPNGLDELEYLDRLYALATRDAWEKGKDTQVAEGVKQALAKMRKGAETTETRTAATPERSVTKAPPSTPTFTEAYEAAKRGERWE